MAQKIVLKEDKVLEKWAQLVPNAQGRGNQIIEETAKAVQTSNAPGVRAEMARVYPKIAPGLLDKQFSNYVEKQGRDYLMITNDNIKSMRLLIGAQDYGNSLNISWYLVCEPNTLSKVFGAFSGKTSSDGSKWSPFITDLFMEEELTAYTTLTHHCVLSAVEALMLNLGQDFSRVDRKSKGFMGIS
jgi:hypothetical protein